jgi:hypothetical protein
VISDVVATVPDSLLADARAAGGDFASAAEARERYVRYLALRLQAPRAFLAEAVQAQEQLRREPPLHLKARR